MKENPHASTGQPRRRRHRRRPRDRPRHRAEACRGRAAVVVNDVDPEPAQETAALVEKNGGHASVSTHNTVDFDEARTLIEQAVTEFAKLDIVVNNAGITRDRMFHNLDDAQFDLVLDVNLKTASASRSRCARRPWA